LECHHERNNATVTVWLRITFKQTDSQSDKLTVLGDTVSFKYSVRFAGVRVESFLVDAGW
jgi:hypothetical protein